jgi:hypothetical protein
VGSTIDGLAFTPLKAIGRSMDGFDFGTTRTCSPDMELALAGS